MYVHFNHAVNSLGMNIFLEWAADHLRNIKQSRAKPIRSVRSIKGKRRERRGGIKHQREDKVGSSEENIDLGKGIATSRF